MRSCGLDLHHPYATKPPFVGHYGDRYAIFLVFSLSSGATVLFPCSISLAHSAAPQLRSGQLMYIKHTLLS